MEIPLGVKLEKASLKWSGWESSTAFGGSDAAPEGGYEALVGKVLQGATSNGAEIKLSSIVTSIKKNSEIVTVGTGSETYTSKTVICTIPLGVLKTLPQDFFTPSLPPHLQEIIAGTHVGVLEKLLMHYPTAWWPDATSVGSYTLLPTSSTPVDSTSTPLEIFSASTLVVANFACPSLPSPSPTLLTYLSETPAQLLLAKPLESVIRAYHTYFTSRLAPSSDTPGPSEYALTTWLTDPFSRGATTTPTIVSEGERSPMDFKELGRPVWDGKLGFAGEHTEMEHRGSVAGAVVSGIREAERVGRLLERAKED
jgi:monoamine oxidase